MTEEHTYKYWVTMTDKFMSGWGLAQGKTNKLVLECETFEEAEIVEQHALGRGDMNYVNVRSTKPYYNSSRYYVSWHNRYDGYSSWYEK
jgi:hypothetical protein